MRQALQDIIFAGRLTRTVEILGKNWVLQTVDSKDNIEFLNELKNEKDDNVKFLKFRQNMIAKSLVSVDGIELKDDEGFEFISSLPIQIVSQLYDEYTELTKQIQVTPETLEELKEDVKN